jgi:hypothetical protein
MDNFVSPTTCPSWNSWGVACFLIKERRNVRWRFWADISIAKNKWDLGIYWQWKEQNRVANLVSNLISASILDATVNGMLALIWQTKPLQVI